MSISPNNSGTGVAQGNTDVSTRDPANPYPLDQWKRAPRHPKPNVLYKRYRYNVLDSSLLSVSDNTLEGIARNLSESGMPITADELATLNWGTTDPAEINSYLKNYNECKYPTPKGSPARTAGIAYALLKGDGRPWLWAPGKLFVLDQTPTAPYALAEWLQRPRNPKIDEEYEKYFYQDNETLNSIATRLSGPLGRTITWADLANLNWGTNGEAEVNYYLKNHNQCKTGEYLMPDVDQASGDSMRYLLRQTGATPDANPFIWVPKTGVAIVLRSKYRAPGRQDVGHVAPYHQGRSFTNTLVIPATYVIELKLGDIDALYDCDANGKPTALGRKQRLQALGYLYRPLGHTQIDRAFDKVWEYYRNVHTKPEGGLPNDEELNALLQAETRNNIIGRLPSAYLRKGQFLEGRLPEPDKFGMIRFPGGYCFNAPEPKYDDAVVVSPTDAKYNRDLGDDLFTLEDKVFTENEPMGKIPLVATVHRITLDGQREPAQGVTVYFQLVKPDDLPPNNTLLAPAPRNMELDFSKDWKKEQNPDDCLLANRGPKRFIDDVLRDVESPTNLPDQNNPRKGNCPTKYGGKRDVPVAGNIFEVETARPGFHNTPKARHASYGDLPPAQMFQSNSDAHKYAVRAKTNDKGHAGVIFTPSRMGGDRYKIRAYVGPETLEFDGSNDGGPVVETGTLVVWRNIRLNRYLQMPIPPQEDVSDTCMDILNYSPMPGFLKVIKAVAGGVARRKMREMGWKLLGLDKPYDTIDFSHVGTYSAPWAPSVRMSGSGKKAEYNTKYRPARVQFIGPSGQFRSCYCEFLNDAPDEGRRPEQITPEMMRAAFDAGLRAVKAANPLPSKTVDWDTYVFYDATSPFMMNVRHWKHYNKIKKPTFPELTAEDNKKLGQSLENTGLPGIMAYFSGGGLLPGLTVVHTPFVTPWQALYPDDSDTLAYEGIAVQTRGAFLTGTEAARQHDNNDYNLSAVANHELGHCLGRTHQPPNPNHGQQEQHEPQEPSDTSPNSFHCVMCYMGCLGDFCGRCNLALRGWHARCQSFGAGV